MAFILTLSNVTTRMYQEIIDEISRSTNSITQAAIDAALDEARGFMGRYDIDKILGTASANATVTDANLLAKLKDMFVWHFIALANPNIEYAAAHDRYVLALEYFGKIQNGKIAPPSWPFIDSTTQTAPAEGNSIYSTSNPKRIHHF